MNTIHGNKGVAVEIADALQLGVGGVTLFLLMQVWNELKAVNAFNRELLTRFVDDRIDAAEERHAIAQAVNADLPPKPRS